MSVSVKKSKKTRRTSDETAGLRQRQREKVSDGTTRSLRHQQDGSEITVRKATDTSSRRNGTYLIYGLSGTGKTTIAASFPGPILLIDIKDEGDESVSDLENVDVVEPQTLEEFEAIYWLLKNHKRWRKYKTVVVDTLTQLQAMVVGEIASQKSRAKFAGKKSAGAWGTMTMGQWGTAADIMKTQIMNFRGLTQHTVFLAQQKMIDADESGEDDVEDIMLPEVGPAMMKSVQGMACAASSFIGHTFIRSVVVKKKLRKRRVAEYCMRVGPNPVFITKTRKPKSIRVPDFVANPSYEVITNLIKGKTTDGS